MAMVAVADSSLQAFAWPKLVGLVLELAAIWHCPIFMRWTLWTWTWQRRNHYYYYYYYYQRKWL